MAIERVLHFNLPSGSPNTTAGHATAVPPMHNLPRLCKRGGQRHLRPPLPLMRSRQRHTSLPHGHHLPTEADVAHVDPVNHNSFCDSFCAVADDIAKGLSTSRSAAANGIWLNWTALYRDVDLDPLLILYRDLFLLLNAFARQYRTGAIYLSGHQVRL